MSKASCAKPVGLCRLCLTTLAGLPCAGRIHGRAYLTGGHHQKTLPYARLRRRCRRALAAGGKQGDDREKKQGFHRSSGGRKWTDDLLGQGIGCQRKGRRSAFERPSAKPTLGHSSTPHIRSPLKHCRCREGRALYSDSCCTVPAARFGAASSQRSRLIFLPSRCSRPRFDS
jgi:hypothetical protein